MGSLESDQRTDKRSCLARFDARCEQKQQRVQIVLFGYYAVLAQVLGDDRSWNSMRFVFTRDAVETGRQQRQLVRIGHGESGNCILEAMPASVRYEIPEPGVARDLVGGNTFPSHFVHAVLTCCIGQADEIRHKGIEKPAARRIGFLPLELSLHRPQFLSQFDAEPDRVVPQDFARSVPSSFGRRRRVRQIADKMATSSRVSRTWPRGPLICLTRRRRPNDEGDAPGKV